MYVAKEADQNMVVLHVPVAGTTTSGSKNTRIELRQMKDAHAKAGFSLKGDPRRTLKTRITIQHLPVNWNSTSFVQIFNGGYSADKTVKSPQWWPLHRGHDPEVQVFMAETAQ